ncbi:hypothetical protein [Devosia naphthalenivorans]|uniref:hypothetical protein n=1 Tax=Devosia naphthalenivorans TaxID=2082392 RepID=UPI0013B0580C|nr:hypothetical protein [Devosia naphthalenivorans]
MTQETFEGEHDGRLQDVLAADEARTGVLRQITNGVGGLLLLLVTGLLIVLLVLWKSP